MALFVPWKVMLRREMCDVHVWVGLITVVLWASNTDLRESYASCSCTYGEGSDCSSGNALLWCRRDCSQSATVSPVGWRIAREASPEMLDILVSTRLGDDEEQVFVLLLVENEKHIKNGIPESFHGRL